MDTVDKLMIDNISEKFHHMSMSFVAIAGSLYALNSVNHYADRSYIYMHGFVHGE